MQNASLFFQKSSHLHLMQIASYGNFCEKQIFQNVCWNFTQQAAQNPCPAE